MFAWRGGRGRHYAKSTQGRQYQVGPPWVQNPGYAPGNTRTTYSISDQVLQVPAVRRPRSHG